MNGSVRIVVEALSARSGGGQTYLKYLLSAQIPDGIEVTVLAPPQLPFLHDVAPGVSVHRIADRYVRPGWRAIWSERKLPGLLEELGADLLFSPGGTLPVATVTCRTATMFQNMLPFDHVQRKTYPIGYVRARLMLLERVLRRSAQQADLVIFISEHGRRVMEAATGPLRASVVIPHGIDGAFRSAPGSSDRDNAQRDYVYVSNIEPYKGQLEVVRAFAMVRRRDPDVGMLRLVGPISSARYAEAVLQESRRLGVADDVVFVGRLAHEELPSIYRDAHIGIFASRCENCPNVLLEAMAAGRPLAISNVEPMPEFAGPDVSYFDPADPTALAELLLELEADPSRRRREGELLRVRSLKYEWTDAAAQTWDTLGLVARGHGPPRPT